MSTNSLLRHLGVFLAAAIPSLVSAQAARINVVSFNLGWWISSSEFSQFLSQCNEPARNWCDPRDEPSKCSPTSKGLPPCNAYTEYYRSSTTRPTPIFAPTAAYWDARRSALDGTLGNLAADIIAFQEISGEAAAKDVLGSARDEFSYCQSVDKDPSNPEAQHLVIAARKSVFAMNSCQTDQSLAVEDANNPGHFTRPALLADLTGPAGKRWRVANLHLKSSCSSPAGDPRFDFRGAYLDSADNKNCPTLRKQVAPLEQLIEREGATGAHFVLLGDFNRKIDLELKEKAAGPTRVGGASPIGIPGSEVQVRLLWPEVNDGDPAGSKLTLLSRESRASTCARNEGLDHIALSQNLAVVNHGVRAREVDLADFGNVFKASDHCPLFAQLKAP